MCASELRKRKMDTSLTGLIEMFATTKATEGKSPQTITWYQRRLKVYAAFLGPQATLRDISLASAREFIAQLQARQTRYAHHPLAPEREGGLSPQTVHGYVRCLKVFTAWLTDEGFLPQNVLLKLRRPKVPETMIEVLSDKEIASIFESISPNCPLGSRMHTIFMLLLDTGIRAEELCTLTLENTNLDQNYIKVLGKGNKERKVNFGANTKKALLRYLTLYRPVSEEKTLFLTNEGHPMTYSALAHIIKRIGRRTGVERLHTHLFRHTFAVRFLCNGGDLITLKTLLGHVDVSITQIYLKLTQQNIAEVYSRNSPMDRFDFKKKR